MCLLADDAEGRARPGRVEQVPLAPAEHEHEVLAVVKVALGDDPSSAEPALDPLLVAHLFVVDDDAGDCREITSQFTRKTCVVCVCARVCARVFIFGIARANRWTNETTSGKPLEGKDARIKGLPSMLGVYFACVCMCACVSSVGYNEEVLANAKASQYNTADFRLGGAPYFQAN